MSSRLRRTLSRNRGLFAKDVSIGGAGLAAAPIQVGLVDELRMFRNPVVVGGGTPFVPAVPKTFG